MIPFSTLSERHLVYAYCAVWILQFGYGTWLAIQWRRSGPGKKTTEQSGSFDPLVRGVAFERAAQPGCLVHLVNPAF